MRPNSISFLVARIRAEHLCRELMQLAFVLTVVVLLAGQTAAFGADIFRTAPASGSSAGGGELATGSGGKAAAPLSSTIDTAALLQQRALAALNRTDTAIRAVNAAQQAARAAAAAAASNVPNGLQAGGLEPLDLSAMDKWKGSLAPTTAAGKPNDVTIVQNEQNALLTWKTFNIGRETTLTFDQSKGGASAGQWIAFNYVQDPDAKPSQILGKIQTLGAGAADAQGNKPVGGQVYVLNPNGIIFGGASQVNVHGLVASTLPINYNLVQRGLLDNPDAQFLFSAIAQEAGETTGVFDPAVATDYAPVQTAAGGSYGDVVVEAGAQLTAPTNSAHVGGRIALIGPNVTNKGTISTADGQTILAAGLQVGLVAHNSDDPTLRGLDVYVGKVADESLPQQTAAGTATNASNALIDAARGSVYITGKEVRQSGVIDSSTSVAYNGRVDLVASYNAVTNPVLNNDTGVSVLPFIYPTSNPSENDNPNWPTVESTGRVTLGADSLLRILPETVSTEKIAGDLALRSVVNILGQSIYFEKNAAVFAPNAGVSSTKPATSVWLGNLSAGVTLQAAGWYSDGISYYQPVRTSDRQQIYFETGASISVAGTSGAKASVTDNIISVELRAAETADSPVQRDSPLRGQTVEVDIRQHGDWDATLNDGEGGYAWVGTPLVDTSGWVNLVQHDVAQLSVDGGTVALSAGGAVILNSGATIDVSGGYTDYAGGVVKTTKVISGNNIYDIAKATSDLKYDGIYTGASTTTDTKWGTSHTESNTLFGGVTEAGYKQGGNAGSLAITSPQMALDGALMGQSYAGVRQVNLAPSSVYTAGTLPTGTATGEPGWLLTADRVPLYGQLELSFQRQIHDLANTTPMFFISVPKPSNIVLSGQSAATNGSAAVEDFDEDGNYSFFAERDYELVLSTNLFRNTVTGSGFGIVSIDNSYDDFGKSEGYGNITVADGALLEMAVGGTMKLKAGNITIGTGARVSLPSGYFGAEAYSISSTMANWVSAWQNMQALPPDWTGEYDDSRGTVTIGGGATVSTAGALVDLWQAGNTTKVPLVTQGGSVSLSGSKVQTGKDSTIDVSGGGVIAVNGKLTAAAAGKITLAAGKALGSGFGSIYGGDLELGGSLLGLAGVGKAGGSLSVQAPSVVVDRNTTRALSVTDASGRLGLSPEFFKQGGFTSYSVKGLGLAYDAAGEVVAETAVEVNASIIATAMNWDYLPGDTSGTALKGIRRAVSLMFSAGSLDRLSLMTNDFNTPEVRVGAGTEIETDAGGSVSLQGPIVEVLGTITAHGGKIALSASGVTKGMPSVHLGATSHLDATGAVTWKSDSNGYYEAEILAGGTIAVEGNIVAEKGAVLDVSGAEGRIYATPAAVSSDLLATTDRRLASATTQSNGGRISLLGSQILLSAAELRGGAGGDGTGARAGELVVSNKRDTDSMVTTAADAALVVTQSVPEFAFVDFDTEVTDFDGNILRDSRGLGLGSFGVDSILVDGKAQFGALSLAGDGVEFRGAVTIDLSRQLSVADKGVLVLSATPAASADDEPSAAKVTLSAPYVRLGTGFNAPGAASGLLTDPLGGSGTLAVRAGSLLDFGDLVVRGGGISTFSVTDGAIRGSGTVETAGTLGLSATQIYPVTASTLNFVVRATTDADGDSMGGVLRVVGNGRTASLPYSAGGTLGLYAETIEQGGVLRAPLGTINLGAQSATTADPVTATYLPTTVKTTLLSGSVTSVSAIDPITGKGVSLPYGVIVNGETWYAPTGEELAAGPAAKHINISGVAVEQQAGATVDLTGGGDLLTYEFVPGNGGTRDILDPDNTANAFAILPAAAFDSVPSSAFVRDADLQALLTDVGVSNPSYGWENSAGSYQMGDSVYLQGGGDLPAGRYVILPARYALLDGAYLVTPRTTSATVGTATTQRQADGSYLMSGFRFNAYENPTLSSDLYKTYEVASGAVVTKRATYERYGANTFFAERAEENDAEVPRLPADGGQLAVRVNQALVAAQAEAEMVATQLAASAQGEALALDGKIATAGATGARGGLVDIASTRDILVGSASVLEAARATGDERLGLRAEVLSSIGADSLLIGGVRNGGASGSAVIATTANVTVDNAGEAITGRDVTLVAANSLTLATGAALSSAVGSGTFVTDPLALGDEDVAGSGNGALLRVSADAEASVVRAGVSGSAAPSLTIGAGAALVGSAVILDTTAVVSLDPTVNLSAGNVTLGSRRVSVLLDPTFTVQTTDGLVLAGDALASLQRNASGLALQSYTTIDLYGAGTFGSASLHSLSLHTGELRGFTTSPTSEIVVTARNLEIDNAGSATDATLTTTAPAPVGALRLAAVGGTSGTGIVQLGANDTAVRQFSSVAIEAASGIQLAKTGALTVDGDLAIQAPGVAAAVSSDHSIAATGDLRMTAPTDAGTATLASGLGGKLSLQGKTVTVGTNLTVPSGTIAVRATGGDLVLEGAALDVRGAAKDFYDVTKYTDGGTISLRADVGQVNVGVGNRLDVSAASGGGDAGTVSIVSPTGDLVLAAETILGQAGTNGLGGSFSADVAGVSTDGHLADLYTQLTSGGFDQSATLRIRTGDVISDGALRAHTIALSADAGDITVSGTLDASGLIDATQTAPLGGTPDWVSPTGGSIALAATGSVRLTDKAWLSVAGALYDNSGKGGSVSLSAGGYTAAVAGAGTVDPEAVVSVGTGSQIDLGVVHKLTLREWQDGDGLLTAESTRRDLAGGGTLHLRAPVIFAADGTTPVDVGIDPLRGKITGAASIVTEGFRVYDLTAKDGLVQREGAITSIGTGGQIDSIVEQTVLDDATAFGALDTAIADRLLSELPVDADREALAKTLHVQPGVEIVNHSTDSSTHDVIVLNTAAASAAKGWSSFAVQLRAATAITLASLTGISVDPTTVTIINPSAALVKNVPATFLVGGGTSTGTLATSGNSLVITSDKALSMVVTYANGTTKSYSVPTTTAGLTYTATGTETKFVLSSTSTLAAKYTVKKNTVRCYDVLAALGGTVTAGQNLKITSKTATDSLVVTLADGTTKTTKITTSGLTYVATGEETAIAINGVLTTKSSNFTVAQLSVDPSTIEMPIPGGMYAGAGLNFTVPTTWMDAKYQVNFADGGSSAVQAISGSTGVNFVAPAGRIVKSITLINGSTTQSSANAVTVGFYADSAKGATSTAPVAFALPEEAVYMSSQYTWPGTGEKIKSLTKTVRYSVSAADLSLVNTWDFSTWRFGSKVEPGNLTLRAAGNLVLGFGASLSDGFDTSAANALKGSTSRLWTAPLLADDSWSFSLVAGADYAAADASRTVAADSPAAGALLLGYGSPALSTLTGSAVTRALVIPQYYQTVRTGTGDIALTAASDVRFLNPQLTVYSSGKADVSVTSLYDTDDFDLPDLFTSTTAEITGSPEAIRSSKIGPWYGAQYSYAGGDVTITAGGDIARYTIDSKGALVSSSSLEMPTSWLYRRGLVGADGLFASLPAPENYVNLTDEVQSTSWWIDFSNFFADVGALGGGNVSLHAGRSVHNVQASVPTNARMPGRDAAGNPIAPDAEKLIEYGGGDLHIRAGSDIDGGVYYVERGELSLVAGGSVTTNSTRALPGLPKTDSLAQLPTTFFLGKGSLSIDAGGSVDLGAVVNPFWLPQGAGNRSYERSYFSTFALDASVTVNALGGEIRLRADPKNGASLYAWYDKMFSAGTSSLLGSQPWLAMVEVGSGGPSVLAFRPSVAAGSLQASVFSIQPGTLRATAFSADISILGTETLSPSPLGTVELLSNGSINAMQPNAVSSAGMASWNSAAINLSDADPGRLPGVASPISFDKLTVFTPSGFLNEIHQLFSETGSPNLGLTQRLALHGRVTGASGDLVPLHYEDADPLRLYAGGGDLSGLTLFSGKESRVLAARDITDVAIYVQNLHADDTTLIAAGRDIVLYDPHSNLRLEAGGSLAISASGATFPVGGNPNAGDIQIAGPGTVSVLAGRDLDLGNGAVDTSRNTALGITTVGAARNLYLEIGAGADIVVIAGATPVPDAAAGAATKIVDGHAGYLAEGETPGLSAGAFDFDAFMAKYLDPASLFGTEYLPVLAGWLGLPSTTPVADVRTWFNALSDERRSTLVLDLFARVLRDAGRDRNDPESATYGSYAAAYEAIRTFVPGSLYKEKPEDTTTTSGDSAVKLAGDLSLPTRMIKTYEGGDITILVPGGGVTVGRSSDPQTPEQGILTQYGGNISIFAQDSVEVGTSRIFTLRGGNEIIWSSLGGIAAGSGSKTVASAPPTRVLFDPSSADVQNDLAGLATGSGIGVLATLKDVPPGDIDLIAPVGTIDAGDAGIRSTGNINIASLHVANAANIATGGSSAGVPAATAPSLGGVVAAASSSTTGSSKATVAADSSTTTREVMHSRDLPSLIQVEVIGYGGGDKSDEDEQDRDSNSAKDATGADQAATPAPPQA